ncbi:baseplate assembly protein [Brevibacillus porteri]|uniref:baseplate assembly protein n=1 Tax=Brevibacillus porteri TaxID=2126350 RepID=UPI003D25D568
MTRLNLPDIQFAQKSAEQIEAEVVARFEEKANVTLTKADPRRKFIQSCVYLLSLQRSNIDYSAKQNLLAYAQNNKLDHLGAFVDTPRLQPTFSKTTERFHLSVTQAQTIPAGTRVSAGDGIFFAVEKDVPVPVGKTYVDVEAICTQVGSVGNGYLPGQINQLVDPIQWIQSVENITESDGGSDVEEDDPYAERIQQAPEKFSVAGPDGAYKYWARSASPLIVDVSVQSPAPVEVEIRPLLKGGEIPGPEILDLVYQACNDRSIRPLTDFVKVLAPEAITYDLSLTYWIRTSDSSVAASIKQKVKQAIQDYKVWQKSKLGRDIDPTELITRIKNAGAKRVAVVSPVYKAVATHQVAVDLNTTVTYGGLEDD